MNHCHCFFIFIAVLSVTLVIYLYHVNKLINKTIKLGNEDKFKLFVPTNDWQRIDKDQLIPRKTHVRINLQTGEREAKILSAEETNKQEEKFSLSVVGHDEQAENFYSVDDSINTNDVDRVKKFRTYEQLKEEMSQLNLNVVTDVEYLNKLIEKFSSVYDTNSDPSSPKLQQLISLLQDLEYLLHQGDNAEEFAKKKGMTTIIVPCLLHNSTSIKTVAARVLGAAVQNNPKVQIASLEANVITPLLKNIALQNNFETRSSSIYALSCLVRKFPLAQIKLIDEGGLSVLLSLLEENSNDSFKLQIKIVTLFNDLIMERIDAKDTLQEEKLISNISDVTRVRELQQMTEKLHQYDNIELITKLVERGYCNKISRLFTNRIFKNVFINASDIKHFHGNIYHDIVDKLLNSMLLVMDYCEDDFKSNSQFYPILINLKEYYKMLSVSEEEEDQFFHNLYDMLHKLSMKFEIK